MKLNLKTLHSFAQTFHAVSVSVCGAGALFQKTTENNGSITRDELEAMDAYLTGARAELGKLHDLTQKYLRESDDAK